MVAPLLNAPHVAFGADLGPSPDTRRKRSLRAPLLLGDLMHVKRVAALAAPLIAIPGAIMLNPLAAKAGPNPAGCTNVFQAVTCTYAATTTFTVPPTGV